MGKILLLRTIRHHTIFCSDVGFTNIVVWSTGQFGEKTRYGVPNVPGQWSLIGQGNGCVYLVMIFCYELLSFTDHK